MLASWTTWEWRRFRLPAGRQEALVTNHQRRFAVPVETPSAMPGAADPAALAALAARPNSHCSPEAMLAQMYALAYEQARHALQQRQWEELLERLFNSPT